MKEMSIPTLALQRTVVLSVAHLECPPLCVTAILHSFLNHLFHQHLSLQRDSAMC